MKSKAKQNAVYGFSAPSPDMTRYGWWLLLKAVVLPIFGVLLMLDGIGYVIARYVFGSCYGVLCLIQ